MDAIGIYEHRLLLRYRIQVALLSCVKNSGITIADLTARLGRSPEWVDSKLSGMGVLTLNDISDIALACDAAFQFRLVPVGYTDDKKPSTKRAKKKVKP